MDAFLEDCDVRPFFGDVDAFIWVRASRRIVRFDEAVPEMAVRGG
jgi:hypothetical protein